MKTAEDYGATPERAPRSGRCFYQRAVENGLTPKGQQFPVQSRAARTIEQYVIPAQTAVAVRRLFGPRWQRHLTKEELHFDRYERRDSAAGRNFFEFRHEGWLILVDRRFVEKRNVPRPEQGGIRPWAGLLQSQATDD